MFRPFFSGAWSYWLLSVLQAIGEMSFPQGFSDYPSLVFFLTVELLVFFHPLITAAVTLLVFSVSLTDLAPAPPPAPGTYLTGTG